VPDDEAQRDVSAVSTAPLFEALPAGGANRGAVVRVGSTVRRPSRPNSTSVQRLLTHLESVGFPGVPRPLGFDDEGRELLTWVEGEVPHRPAPLWALSVETLSSIGELLQDFRRAASTLRARPDDNWFSEPAVPRPFATTANIGHNDIDFGNIVFKDRRAAALIDFDFAGPSDLVWEVAVAAYYLVPLRHPGATEPSSEDRALRERALSLADACGLATPARQLFWDAVTAFHHWRLERAERSGRADAWWMARFDADTDWLARHPVLGHIT
jgi:hypothetical protein